MPVWLTCDKTLFLMNSKFCFVKIVCKERSVERLNQVNPSRGRTAELRSEGRSARRFVRTDQNNANRTQYWAPTIGVAQFRQHVRRNASSSACIRRATVLILMCGTVRENRGGAVEATASVSVARTFIRMHTSV